MKNLSVFTASVASAWLIILILIPQLRKRRVIDVPTERSSHKAPTPRGGGVGIIVGMVCGVFVGWIMGQPLLRPELLAGVMLVALVGFADDCNGNVPVRVRLAVQVMGAGIVSITAGGLPQMPLPAPIDVATGLLGIPLGIFWIVAVTNIYNFLDGIDGFAGLQGTIAALSIAVMALLEEVMPVAIIGLAVAGSCLGFLIHNWHPARIFMGDVGSGTLGFLFASLPFEMQAESRGTGVFCVTFFLWFFLSDGFVTLLHRMKEGERFWEAHRSHLYQRLVRTGLQHDQVTMMVLGPGAVLAGLSLVAVYISGTIGKWAVLAIAMAVLLLYEHLIIIRERQI